ncbi:MAG: hypothetical protein NW700_16985 [Nitrospiraceae bacterium]
MMDREDNTVTALLMDIAGLLREFPQALEQRAAEIQATGKDPELVGKLMKGADAMRDSGNIYLSWAKHYADLSEGNSDAATEDDETEDFDV